MANPKWHIVHSFSLFIVYLCFFLPFAAIWGRGIKDLLLVFGFGVLIDIDHLSRCFFRDLSLFKIKNLITGKIKDLDLQPIGWVNYLHAWQAMVGVAVFSLIIRTWLPLASYLIHIVVDSANRANPEYQTSPLPIAIHRFFPRWLT